MGKYGQPFLSKKISEQIKRLQKHHFQWEDDTYENLVKKYCKEIKKEDAFSGDKLKKYIFELNGKYYRGCSNALKWWCNLNGENSQFNIERSPYLKEFLIKYPPDFLISADCCSKSKKKEIHQYLKKNKIQLNVYGVRKAEGGIRSTSYKSCFSKKDDVDEFRPIFWLKNKDKQIYEERYNIVHSDCYNKYGLIRTGCVGCPFSQNLENELEAAKKFEPKLYKAIMNVFANSYEYTKKYYAFREDMKKKEKGKQDNYYQESLFDLFPLLMNVKQEVKEPF